MQNAREGASHGSAKEARRRPGDAQRRHAPWPFSLPSASVDAKMCGGGFGHPTLTLLQRYDWVKCSARMTLIRRNEQKRREVLCAQCLREWFKRGGKQPEQDKHGNARLEAPAPTWSRHFLAARSLCFVLAALQDRTGQTRCCQAINTRACQARAPASTAANVNRQRSRCLRPLGLVGAVGLLRSSSQVAAMRTLPVPAAGTPMVVSPTSLERTESIDSPCSSRSSSPDRATSSGSNQSARREDRGEAHGKLVRKWVRKEKIGQGYVGRLLLLRVT